MISEALVPKNLSTLGTGRRWLASVREALIAVAAE